MADCEPTDCEDVPCDQDVDEENADFDEEDKIDDLFADEVVLGLLQDLVDIDNFEEDQEIEVGKIGGNG